MRTHIQILAALQIAYAVIGILVALGILLLFGGLAAMVGISGPADDAAVAAPLLAVIGTVTAGFLALLSVPRLIVGIGLLQRRSWARVLTLIVCAIGLFEFPIGTALGIYGFWVLTREESAVILDRPAAQG
jgi:hypothetical protein